MPRHKPASCVVEGVSNQNAPNYVLITCTEPSLDGKMDVKMDYQGDNVLLSYLLQRAQTMFDEQENE